MQQTPQGTRKSPKAYVTPRARWCPPPVLAHPYAAEQRIALSAERYGARLP
jgi:hypothetical protein